MGGENGNIPGFLRAVKPELTVRQDERIKNRSGFKALPRVNGRPARFGDGLPHDDALPHSRRDACAPCISETRQGVLMRLPGFEHVYPGI